MRVILMIPLMFSLLHPAPLTAGEQLTGETFDRYTLGRTLYYGFEGTIYGVERYLPDRQVLWSFLDGRCQKGHWYEDADQICFVYEDNNTPQCWRFALEPEGLIAQFESDPRATELYEVEDLDEDMLCYGPEVGV
ncbi:hypothetical protein FEE96_07510 [Parasedimentitalea maritima]|uniref:DUF995 domain-containing protein n=2 Tax=Parasedimentitalea maritima TaxID=2578117 RepID=A0ABY2UX30_9RHOB|nr:hypothetical protein [Zongyanglinia marina]TLP67184.1 hypothetical protein FEE96_07510 [Zongyanglinia marina]